MDRAADKPLHMTGHMVNAHMVCCSRYIEQRTLPEPLHETLINSITLRGQLAAQGPGC